MLSRSGRLYLWFGVTTLAFGVFARITRELLEGEVDTADRAILLLVAKLRSPSLTVAAMDVTALGSTTLIVLFAAAALVILLARRDRLGACHLLTASAGAALLVYATKNIIERARPPEIQRLVEVTGFSYPSGHSLMTASLYLTLAIIAGRHLGTQRVRIALFAAALVVLMLVGASRIYLGVHYPTDVASGLSLGAAWALLLAGVFSRFSRETRHENCARVVN